jgi:predicted PurR-regulated permease PerM
MLPSFARPYPLSLGSGGNKLQSRRQGPDDFTSFARRVLFIAALIVLGFLAWELRRAFLLIFSGALLALVLRILAAPFVHWTPLRTGAAISVVLIFLLILISSAGLMLGSELSSQLAELWTRLPEFANRAELYFEQSALVKAVTHVLGSPAQAFNVLTTQNALNAATVTFGLFVDVLIIVFLGLFFAYAPQAYINGLVALIPAAQRLRARDVLSATGQALRLWLAGQFASMVTIGSISWIGLSLLNVPLALGLAFLAFLFEFIPVIGPVIAAIPAILVGLSISPLLGLWVTLLYVGIHLIESYAVVPLLQRWAVHVPPALTVIGIVIFGGLFGWMGVVLATPLMVTTIVWVKKIYLESVLKENVG